MRERSLIVGLFLKDFSQQIPRLFFFLQSERSQCAQIIAVEFISKLDCILENFYFRQGYGEEVVIDRIEHMLLAIMDQFVECFFGCILPA